MRPATSQAAFAAAALVCCCCFATALAAGAPGVPSDFCSKRDKGRYSHPATCSAYVVCFEEAVRDVAACPACPQGSSACAGQQAMAFDQQSQRCVW